jgi:DNA polymerase-3 subunit delta'
MARAAAKRDDEAPLEADRLADFPHPRETVVLCGHATREAELRAAFDSGRMHHAWLLTGPEGVGKATLAYRLARYALATPAERARAPAGTLDIGTETGAARRILAQAEPGLLVIRRQTDGKKLAGQIRVDDVRRLRSFLSLTAADGGWRVVIVDPADDLNANAANALLKSLEEPPSRCIFVLVSSAPGRLIPTIRSRCRTLELAPLGRQDLLSAIEAATAGRDDDLLAGIDLDRLEVIGKGSVGGTLQLLGAGGAKLYERIVGLLESLPDLDNAKVHTLSDELSGAAAEELFETFFVLLIDLLARLVRCAAEGGGALPAEVALAQRLIRPDALARWAELWETIVSEKAVAAALNLDRKNFVMATFLRMRDTQRAA